MELDQLSRTVIGCAIEVHRQLVDRPLDIDCRSVRLFLFDLEAFVRA